jgi:hypothetical protein
MSQISAHKLIKKVSGNNPNFITGKFVVPTKNIKIPDVVKVCGKYEVKSSIDFSLTKMDPFILRFLVSLGLNSSQMKDCFSKNEITILNQTKKLKTFLISVFGKEKIDTEYNKIFQKEETIVFQMSCRYKDILRMSLGKHIVSCRNIFSGSENWKTLRLANDPITGICFVRDKHGDFIWRNIFRILHDKDNKPYLLFNNRSYGNEKYKIALDSAISKNPFIFGPKVVKHDAYRKHGSIILKRFDNDEICDYNDEIVCGYQESSFFS